jgi:sigma-B regulation protein RsbU (phosphoserine phosphatase)
MKDLKISKKAPGSSLAWRIVFISLFFLVVPLFLNSVFLYEREYEQKKADIETILYILGRERAILIQEEIETQWAVLDAVSQDVGKHAKALKIQEILLPQGLNDKFAFASEKQDALLIGIKYRSTRALVIPVPFSRIIQEISQDADFPYPIHLILSDDAGKVFARDGKESGDDVLSVQIPVLDSNLQVILQVPEEAIQDLHKRDYIFRFLALLFFVGVIGGSLVYWLTRRVARPLRALCKTMERVSEGGVHVRYPPDRMGFEINELGKRFNETLDSLLEHQKEAEVQRIGRERLAEELKIGHEIQASLLPTTFPEHSGIDIATGYLPAKEVSGDFYEFLQLENGSFLIAIADTAGKGVSACLYSLGLRSSIRTLAEVSSDLSEIVLRANDLFWQDARSSGMFVTLWIGIFDPKTALLTFCSQGHPPALLQRGSKVESLHTKGIALGAQALDAIETDQIKLKKGDLLFLYTDGILEAHNIDNELFGKKRLFEFLLGKKKEKSKQIAIDLLREIDQFSEGVAQHDDIAFFLFKYNSD